MPAPQTAFSYQLLANMTTRVAAHAAHMGNSRCRTTPTTKTTKRTALFRFLPLLLLCTMSATLPSAEAAETAEPAAFAQHEERSWRIVPRAEWGAREPTSSSNFTGPAPYVILHHSYQPGVCLTEDACKAAMRSMQNFHMDGHGWPDIGYTFAVGGDGNVYEGRGYNVVGAHAPNYNSRSVGLLLIGNFVEQLPPAPMLQVAQDFIQYSVEIGRLREDYILHGHRQVRDTECPGGALYLEIQKWPHWREVA